MSSSQPLASVAFYLQDLLSLYKAFKRSRTLMDA